MNKDEMKNKCAERAKIFQQAMKSCKSSNPIDCVEWFADRIYELEKENAELDCQKNRNKFCYSCANATERCFRNEIGCPCEKYKSYKDENAELIQENEEMKKGLGCETCQIHLEYMRLNNKIANLEKENTELKAGRDINVFTKQLTKAKEIISEYINILKGYTKNWKKTQEKAEQFISEVEK
jgi:phage-related minor tail protein